MINILFLGDVFGRPGRNIVKKHLHAYLKKFQIDICIANGENLASGRGITEKVAAELYNSGVDVLTSGNHLWDKKEGLAYIASESRIVKPLNYPERAFGNPCFVKDIPGKSKIAVLSLSGQAYMNPVNSPYDALEKILPELNVITHNIIVDFHAEATAEKRALGLFYDGKVSAVIGTHTHIQTADEEILPQGTAYITDAGMTGPHHSVIGIKKEIIFEKTLSGMPIRYDVSNEGLQINGVFISLDEKSGKALQILRIKDDIEDEKNGENTNS